MMVATGFFCFGQTSTDSVYVGTDSAYTGPSDSVKAIHVIEPETKGLTKAGLAKAIGTGTIYNSNSPYHNILHEFTYLVAMWDYCNKSLLQMRANGEVNEKRSRKLERELSNAKAKATSSKYDGLKIESDYYEQFLKQINDRFSE